MTHTVDVFSDVICPWCFIGKRRLEKAIASQKHEVRVRWLPFQLNPTMPKEGISRKEYRTKKFGSWEHSQELDAKVEAVGKEDGISFAFNRIERTPNTLDAHRLIWLADQQGVQGAVVEALFLAYFTSLEFLDAGFLEASGFYLGRTVCQKTTSPARSRFNFPSFSRMFDPVAKNSALALSW